MTDFISFNGHEVDAEQESGAEIEHTQDHVDRQRTFSLSLVESTRGNKKRVWRGTTPILTPFDARAYRELIDPLERGASHVSFAEDMLSSRGLGPKSGSNYTYTAGGGDDGENIVYVAPGDTLSYAAGLGTRWTIIVRLMDLSGALGGDAARVALTSADACVIDGVAATAAEEAAARALLTVANGDVVISGECDVYSVEWWPEILTDEMLEDFTLSTAVTSDLPEVTATGSFFDNDTVAVRGVVLNETMVPCQIDGVWYENARRIEFELLEVAVIEEMTP